LVFKYKPPAGALPQRPRLSRDPLPKVGSPEWHEQEEEETLQIFDLEPLPAEHPFRHLQNVLATPHIGYGRCERGLRCASLRFTGGSMRRIAAALALALPVSPARAKTKSAKEPRAG